MLSNSGVYKWWVLLAGAFLLLVAVCGYYSTLSPLVVWTSPPLDRAGTRVSALAPRGWSLSEKESEVPACLPECHQIAAFVFQAPEPYAWQVWLAHLFHKSLEDAGDEWIFCGPGAATFEKLHVHLTDESEHFYGLGEPYTAAIRAIRPAGTDLQAVVLYYRPEQKAFGATHKPVCASLRIVYR